MSLDLYQSSLYSSKVQPAALVGKKKKKRWVTEWVMINLQSSWLIQTLSQARKEGRGWSKGTRNTTFPWAHRIGYLRRPGNQRMKDLATDLLLNSPLGSSVYISTASQRPEPEDKGTIVEWPVNGKMCRPGRNSYMIPWDLFLSYCLYTTPSWCLAGDIAWHAWYLTLYVYMCSCRSQDNQFRSKLLVLHPGLSCCLRSSHCLRTTLPVLHLKTTHVLICQSRSDRSS